MIPITRVFVTDSHNPARNLAVEERLFELLPPGETYLYLYINDSSIVTGKNQVTWAEVSVPEARKRGIPVLRRISGGGTVYHDRGNVNFSLMTGRDVGDRAANCAFVRDALAPLGIDLTITDHFDLYLGDRKVSGSAFCYKRDRMLHHGTLLVDADLAGLGALLRGHRLTAESHAIASRPAVVTNLRQAAPGVGVSEVVEAMVAAAGSAERLTEPPEPDPASLARHGDWDWRFGRSPRFVLPLDVGDETVVPLTIGKGRFETAGIKGFELVDGCRLRAEDLVAADPARSALWSNLAI